MANKDIGNDDQNPDQPDEAETKSGKDQDQDQNSSDSTEHEEAGPDEHTETEDYPSSPGSHENPQQPSSEERSD